MSAPLVSVITPFFNTARFLAEAIESVLAQNYRPLELLLVDDGSTDDSADIAARFCDGTADARLLRLPYNQGQAAARNVALRQARGELVTFLDADDMMMSDRLRFQVEYLMDHRNVDVVIGSAEYFLEPGVAPPAWMRGRLVPGQNHHRNPMTMLTRRSVFDQIGLFDPACRHCEDMDWVYRAVTAGMVVARVDRVLIRRRIHGENLTYQAEPIHEAASRIALRTARERIARRKRGA